MIAPLSGEVLEVNQKAVDEPETVNEDPYGEGWLVRIRLSDPARGDALMDVDGVQGRTSPEQLSSEHRRLPLAHRRRPRGDARRRSASTSIDDLFEQIPEGVRFGRDARRAGGARRGRR